MSEENKAVVRRVWEEIANQGNFAVADELIAPLTSYIVRRVHSSFAVQRDLSN